MMRLSFLLAVLSGLAAGALATLPSTGDPTDGPFLYVAALPVGMAVAVVLALVWPARAWAYGLLYGLGLFVGCVLALGDAGNLWPRALAFQIVLCLPATLAGALAAWLRRRAAR